jgi:hypothetical protein
MNISWRIWAGAIVVVAVLAFLWMRFHTTPHTPAASAALPDRSVTSPLNLPGGGTAPPDAYHVYSALYQEPAGEPLVFSNDSVTDIPQVSGSCLRPSSADERELTDAFEAANRQTHRWEEKFAIPQGYQLISSSQAADAQNCLQSHAQNAPACEPYKQVRHVRLLGVPGFDQAHTHALVSVVKMCGRYCGNGGIFEVEKKGATWRRSDPSDFTRECSWMY